MDLAKNVLLKGTGAYFLVVGLRMDLTRELLLNGILTYPLEGTLPDTHIYYLKKIDPSTQLTLLVVLIFFLKALRARIRNRHRFPPHYRPNYPPGQWIIGPEPELSKVSNFSNDSVNDNRVSLQVLPPRDPNRSRTNFAAALNLLRKKPEQVKHVNWKNKNKISLLKLACKASYYDADWQEENRLRLEFLQLVRELDCQQFEVLLQHAESIFDCPPAPLPVCRLLLEISQEISFQPWTPMRDDAEVSLIPHQRTFLHYLGNGFYIFRIQNAYEDIINGERLVAGRTVDEDDLGFDFGRIDNSSALYWDRVKLLTLFAYHNVTDESKLIEQGKKFRLLHACAGTDWFPENMLKVLVVAFPHALVEEDEDGNLPIHVAAKGKFDSYDPHDQDEQAYADTDAAMLLYRGNQKATIDILLDASPHTARVPNRAGKLPLELALESGRDWTDGGMQSLLAFYPRAAAKRHSSGKLPLEWLILSTQPSSIDGCRKLLEAYPKAARLPNPKSGKYPLHIAINETKATDRNREKKIALVLKYFPYAASSIDPSSQLPMSLLAAAKGMSLTTIYSLFLAAPVFGAGPKLCRRRPRAKVADRKNCGVCRCASPIQQYVVSTKGDIFFPCCNTANYVGIPLGAVFEPICDGKTPSCWQNKK
jgi:hypothetical protein